MYAKRNRTKLNKCTVLKCTENGQIRILLQSLITVLTRAHKYFYDKIILDKEIMKFVTTELSKLVNVAIRPPNSHLYITNGNNIIV